MSAAASAAAEGPGAAPRAEPSSPQEPHAAAADEQDSVPPPPSSSSPPVEDAPAAAAAAAAPPARKKPRRPGRSLFRLQSRAQRPARDVAALEARADETRRRVRALEERNRRLETTACDLADELASLRVLQAVDAGVGGGGSAGGGGAMGAPSAAAAATVPGEAPPRSARPRLAVSEAIGRVYARQLQTLRSLSSSGGGGGDDLASFDSLTRSRSRGGGDAATASGDGVGGGGGGDEQPLPSTNGGGGSDAVSSALYRASVFGHLGGDCPAQAAQALARLVAERAAAKPLGWTPAGQRPPSLAAAIALYRAQANRAAIVLRRARMLELAGGGKEGDGAAAAAAVEAVVVYTMTPLSHPSIVDELVRHRLDDERPVPVPHDDPDLELAHARAALRAARLSPEQDRALRSACRTFARLMAGAARAWRECARELAPSCPAAAPPVLSEPLLSRLERCVASCQMHRAALSARFYGVMTPLQMCGLLADAYPFMMRPAMLAAAFAEDEAGGGGGGGGGGPSGGSS